MIYPPTLNSTQVAFLANSTSYPIYFTLNKITSFNEIGHMLVRIVKKDLNTSIANTNLFKDGTIYLSKDDIKDERDGTYYVSVLRSYLNNEGWVPGLLYKVQARFGINPRYLDIKDFADWKKEQIDTNAFSEWSTVMIIKAIDEPKAIIVNSESSKKDPATLSKGIESSTLPLFMGLFLISNESNESEDKYKFDIFKDNELYDTSDWLLHTESRPDEYRFSKILLNDESYTVRYTVITTNGYQVEALPYDFLVNETKLNRLTGVTFEAEDDTGYCADNGCINLYLTGKDFNGCYLITRTDEKSNYTIYEDLKYLLFFLKSFDRELIFLDFTVESGIKYKYAFQMQNSSGVRTLPLYENGLGIRMVNFEHSYLYHDKVLLKLLLNLKMSSFKHSVLALKQDTLGSKYPYLSRNGNAYYAEFPVTGTISLVMDDDLTFFTLKEDGYYYEDLLVIPKEKFGESDKERGFCQEGSTDHVAADVPGKLSIDRNLTHDNIFVERKFREKVEEFLNNFEYKLYKSPTEGNIVIVLSNVSLTPNATLGRMIYDFSATAYEVLENTLDNLNTYGIIDIGKFASLTETNESILSFGQISGLFAGELARTSGIDLLNEIRNQEEVIVSSGYRLKVSKITALSFLAYPQIDLSNKILELEAQLSDLLNAGEPTEEIELELSKCIELLSALDQRPQTLTVQVNGKDIVMMPNRIYKLTNIEEDITSIKLKHTTPIIINYVCELIQVEDKQTGIVSLVDTSRLWGLISGIFTETDKILKNYNYLYEDSKTYRIYNLHSDDTVIKDEYGNIILDNTNINVYKSINLFDVIEQEARRQIEVNYRLPNGFNNYDDATLQWDSNGDIFYHFDDLLSFEIEADPGTILHIGAAADTAQTIAIGPTGRYNINPSRDLIGYIMFDQPTFAIVNYVCSTTQMLMKKE